MMDRARWQALMNRLGLGDNTETFDALANAYAEPHRHYHTAEHITHCLGEFDRVRELADTPDEVELALWFHDAVYDVYSHDNEQKSAEWASRFLRENNANEDRIRRVHDLIMATVHEAPAEDHDARLLVDVDLSILGADDATYQRFEKDVRREYRWVPAPLFRRTRRKILQSFLDRESIYFTKSFRPRLEIRARDNLSSAIVALGR